MSPTEQIVTPHSSTFQWLGIGIPTSGAIVAGLLGYHTLYWFASILAIVSTLFCYRDVNRQVLWSVIRARKRPPWSAVWRILLTPVLAVMLLLVWPAVRDGMRSEDIDPVARQLQVEGLLDEAWDLMGGERGTSTIDEFADPERLELARRKVRDALILCPDCSAAHGKMGVYFVATGQLLRAEQELRRAVELDPQNFMARRNLAGVFVLQERRTDAVKQLEIALEVYPDLESMLKLAVLYKRAGQLEASVDLLNRAADIGQGSAEPLSEIGWMLLSMEELEGATRAYERAIRLGLRRADIHYNLGNALRRLGRKEEALSHYNEALEIDPKDESTRRNARLLKQEIQRPPPDTAAGD